MNKEALLERYLNTCAKKHGCLSFKFTSPGHAGVPDRIIIAPQGRIFFIELKAPDGKVSLLQELTLKSLDKMGCKTFIFRTKEEINNFFLDNI